MSTAELGERRRRRRLAERRRRAARRRRNALIATALFAFVVGIAAGSGHKGGASRAAPSDARPAADAAPLPPDVPVVRDFHDPVPVLMYHAISPAPAGVALPGLYVPESEFESQMKWLAQEGYHGVTLAQVFAAWNAGNPIPKNPVVVSFDDGLQSQYVGAKPMLDRLGWPGVLNLEIDHLDTGDLTREQVADLVSSGWELDSHTFTHPDLTAAGVDLKREIADSRAYLEAHFGTAVDFFCYPAGSYDARAVRAVKAAGYAGATTTNEGLARPGDPYELSRIRVEPGDGAEGLAAKLHAAAAGS